MRCWYCKDRSFWGWFSPDFVVTVKRANKKLTYTAYNNLKNRGSYAWSRDTVRDLGDEYARVPDSAVLLRTGGLP